MGATEEGERGVGRVEEKTEEEKARNFSWRRFVK